MTKKTEKQKAIEELIKKQREFENVNKSGYTDEEYWLKQGEYRDRQAELAKLIHKEAHKKYWDEYKDTLRADIGKLDKE